MLLPLPESRVVREDGDARISRCPAVFHVGPMTRTPRCSSSRRANCINRSAPRRRRLVRSVVAGSAASTCKLFVVGPT